MTRRTHNFRSAAHNLIAANALMRHALLKNPAILAALNRYIASLCLQGRIATGQLSETQALIEFEKAIHTFTRKIHTELNKRSVATNIDQTDLSNPLNMQNALNNPLSYASQLMNNTAAAIESAIIDESYQNEQAYLQQNVQSDEQTSQQVTTPAESNEHDTGTAVAKTALLVGAISLFDEKGADAARDKIESAFFKETGIKTAFSKEGPEEEAHTILQKVLKPEFKDFQNHDDKNKG
ncbi:MAG: hypothetical protein Q8L78_05945 [Coxiellaceae bacterium]|nr:hypothetical protein [Coxiellaceae bacterium]